MILQLIVSVLLIILVLLQFGKGAEAGLISGGGASDAVFTGTQQGNILSKATIVLSVLFLVGSINLARLQSKKVQTSIMDSEKPVATPLNDEAPKAETKSENKEAAPVEK